MRRPCTCTCAQPYSRARSYIAGKGVLLVLRLSYLFYLFTYFVRCFSIKLRKVRLRKEAFHIKQFGNLFNIDNSEVALVWRNCHLSFTHALSRRFFGRSCCSRQSYAGCTETAAYSFLFKIGRTKSTQNCSHFWSSSATYWSSRYTDTIRIWPSCSNVGEATQRYPLLFFAKCICTCIWA